jgi:quercetin dioxygenase-like cupin family protein
MMRFLVIALLVALGSALSLPLTARAEGPAEQSNVELAKDVPTVPMAEWEIVQQGAAEQTGARILIAAGAADTAKAPPSASRYESQTFKFAPGDFTTGELRVLKFSKATGGVLHQITTETELYVVKGSAMVGVRGVPTAITAGDVVNLPSGVLRSMPGKPEDTVVLAFTVANTERAPQAVLVKGSEVKLTPQTRGPKVGVGGTKLAVRRYVFDGNSIRVAQLSGRGSTTPYTGGVDVLIYVASGRLKIHVGDEVKEVAAGDVLREQAGKTTFWDVSGPATFIATNSPPRYAAVKP